jgi:hypothetical protein
MAIAKDGLGFEYEFVFCQMSSAHPLCNTNTDRPSRFVIKKSEKYEEGYKCQ